MFYDYSDTIKCEDNNNGEKKPQNITFLTSRHVPSSALDFPAEYQQQLQAHGQPSLLTCGTDSAV